MTLREPGPGRAKKGGSEGLDEDGEPLDPAPVGRRAAGSVRTQGSSREELVNVFLVELAETLHLASVTAAGPGRGYALIREFAGKPGQTAALESLHSPGSTTHDRRDLPNRQPAQDPEKEDVALSRGQPADQPTYLFRSEAHQRLVLDIPPGASAPGSRPLGSAGLRLRRRRSSRRRWCAMRKTHERHLHPAHPSGPPPGLVSTGGRSGVAVGPFRIITSCLGGQFRLDIPRP